MTLPAVASAVGSSLLDIAGSSVMANSANAKNKRSQERANWYNIYNWQLQNEYNLPENQVQRLLDANLNPALLYGSGGSNLSSASPIGTPTSHPAVSGKGEMALMQKLSLLQALKKSEADIDKVNTETESIDTSIAIDKAKLDMEKELLPAKIALMVSQTFNNNMSGKLTEKDVRFFENIDDLLGANDAGKESMTILKSMVKALLTQGRR